MLVSSSSRSDKYAFYRIKLALRGQKPLEMLNEDGKCKIVISGSTGSENYAFYRIKWALREAPQAYIDE